jgi:hypothetical protein
MDFQKELQSYSTNFLAYSTTGNPNNEKLYQLAQQNLEQILQSEPLLQEKLLPTHDSNQTKLRRSHPDIIDPSWRYWVAAITAAIAVFLTSL